MSEHSDPSAAADRVFISYSRLDGAFARRVHAALEARGLGAWLDASDIAPTTLWRAEIERAIAEADVFLFVLSPRSLASVECRRELDAAAAAGKRVVPVVAQAVPPAEAPTVLAQWQWVFADQDERFEPALDALVQAVNTDLPRLRMHTRLLVRAREWRAAGGDAGYLLRGADLAEAERWLAGVVAGGPMPSADHADYLQASQQAQRDEAARWQGLFRRAQTRLLAAQSELLRGQDPRRIELSVLLAAEAVKREPSLEACQSLQQGLRLLPPRAPWQWHIGDAIVNDLAFTPDGRTLVCCDDAGGLRAFDLATGAERVALAAGERLMALALSADSRYVAATGYQSSTVVVMDLASGSALPALQHPGTTVESVAWRAGTATLVCAGADARLWTWDASVGENVGTRDHPGPLKGVAISHDGRWLASGGEQALCLWDLDDDTAAPRWQQPVAADQLAFSPDDRLLAAAGWQGRTELFACDDGSGVALLAHERYGSGLCFTPDGQALLAVGDEQQLLRLELPAAQASGRIAPPTGVLKLAVSADSQVVATAGLSSCLHLWSADLQRELGRAAGPGLVGALAFHPSQRLLACARPGRVQGLDLGGDGLVPGLRHGQQMAGAAFSANGQWLAEAWTDDRITVVHLPSGRVHAQVLGPREIAHLIVADDGERLIVQAEQPDVVQVYHGHSGALLWQHPNDGAAAPWLSRCTASADGRQLAITPREQPLTEIVDSGSGRVLRTLDHRGVFPPAFSADGRQVLTMVGHEVRLWTLDDDAPARVLAHSADAMASAFSADGCWVAGTCSDGSLRLWQAESGALLWQRDHGGGYACALAFSPCGRWLASTGIDSVQLWALPGGEPGHRFEVEGGADHVGFTPDGETVAAGCRDHRVRVWHCGRGDELASIAHDEEVFELQFDAGGRYCLAEHVRGVRRWRTAWLWRPDDLLALAGRSLTRQLDAAEWARYLGDEPWQPTVALPPGLDLA